MAKYGRNRTFSTIFVALFLVAGYAILTVAVAGSSNACSGPTSPGHVEWVWSPVPRYACVTGPRF